MAHLRGDQPLSTIHNILKMLLSPHSSNMPPHHSTDVAEDVDEPPERHMLHGSPISADDGLVYVKSPTAVNQKESLLTRALKTSPDLIPSDRRPSRDFPYNHSYPYHNVSGISTAELTSDGGMTSPSLSNTPSPPLPSQLANRPPPMTGKSNGADASESTVEANLGRKRCISFACGRKVEEPKPQQSPQGNQPTPKKTDPEPTPTEPVQRRTTLKFVCPARDPETKRDSPVRARPRGSPAPIARKPSPEKATPPVNIPKEDKMVNQNKSRGVPTSGLGEFEDSEATRFHEFASSVDEDDEWVKKAAGYTGKITMDDCMKKENAIRKLGEEAEEEALDEEDEEDDEDEDDEDVADDDSTIHDFSDDGNESDNEAGFADSDESDASDTEFWAPSTTTAATTPQTFDTTRVPLDRRNSNTSFDSCPDERRRWSPSFPRKVEGHRPLKSHRARPGTPNLPDSTDFVCGTLDEDHPLEVAYKSCMEQRRISKQVMIPQDIDPSFPTSDPEDQDDEDNEDMNNDETVLPTKDGESSRGRAEEQTRNPSPHRSPKRIMSPPPRRQARSPPKRLRSPPPMKLRFSTNHDVPSKEIPAPRPRGVNISELVQRRPMVNRTKSLPRTPNPFFASMEGSSRWSGFSPLEESDFESPRAHTRGPIDIVEGLEKKRQKRKEKFWRQHCRKAAKEQMERRRVPGKGAERMKELGLEAAERCRGYGVGQDVQLVLSV